MTLAGFHKLLEDAACIGDDTLRIDIFCAIASGEDNANVTLGGEQNDAWADFARRSIESILEFESDAVILFFKHHKITF